MRFVEQLKQKLFDRQLNQTLQKNRAERLSVRFDQAKRIGLIFEGTELPERDQTLEFAAKLKKQGKRVSLMAFMVNKVDNSGFVFNSFNLQDLDFSLRPKSTEVKDFINQPFDILINLSIKSPRPLTYISAASIAKFRVGPYTPGISPYELMIDLSPERNISDFISQVEMYLGKMQTTHEPAAV